MKKDLLIQKMVKIAKTQQILLKKLTASSVQAYGTSDGSKFIINLDGASSGGFKDYSNDPDSYENEFSWILKCDGNDFTVVKSTFDSELSSLRDESDDVTSFDISSLPREVLGAMYQAKHKIKHLKSDTREFSL